MISTLLFIILILLILTLIFVLLIYFSVRSRASFNTIGLNTVDLSINPHQAVCGTANAFTCIITATGWADNGIQRNYRIELFDDDRFSVNLLEKFVTPSVAVGGISPVQVAGSQLFRWTINKTLNLSCDAACKVIGTAGSSGESEAEVFARFKVTHGNPFPSMDSKIVTIKCVTAESLEESAT